MISYQMLVVALLSATIAFISVTIHYEAFSRLSSLLIKLKKLKRLRVPILILGILVLHIVEIWIYAFGYFLLDRKEGYGYIAGEFYQSGLLDFVYFSSMTYTTVGYGDLSPIGAIRILASSEALAGLVLIAWSASFTYLEMQKFWKDR